jgi:hypothetical protein
MSASSSLEIAKETVQAQPDESYGRSLYFIGALAAISATVLFISDFVVLIVAGTPPTSASGWLTLLQTDRAAGLLQLFFSDLISLGLASLMVFALYVALRRVNGVYMTLATILMFVGVAIVFATNPNYSLIYLSRQYAAATSEAQQAQLLDAAEAVLAGMQGTGILFAGLLIEGALVMISAIMFQDRTFGRGIAYLGIAAHGLDLAHSVISSTRIRP